MYQYQIAPMMGFTDRHFRTLMRILGGDAFLLYSEMVTTGAICYGDAERYLSKNSIEGDVVLQIGGSDPYAIAKTIEIAEAYDYAGYNLNVGCPSHRVQNAKIGACLMKEPQLVERVFKVMQSVTDKPVSIKTRLGIDGVDSYDYINDFVNGISVCQTWILHARDAWLQGLNPKQNRSIPPLRYNYVYQLKKENPHLHVTLNGGLKDIESINEALLHVDAVMLGRCAYQNPRLIHELGESTKGYFELLNEYILYIKKEVTDQNIRYISAPLVMALYGYYGAKKDRHAIAQCKDKVLLLRLLNDLQNKL
jgi:tRNA-dihydrouridine synthase A